MIDLRLEKRSSAHCVGGFTLIELMVTIAIVGILSSIAIPAVNDLIVRTSLTTQASQLASTIRLARAKAMSEQLRVIICPNAASGNACGTAWTAGHQAFVDADSNGAYSVGDFVIKFFRPDVTAPTMSVSTSTTGSGSTILQFLPQGRVSSSIQAFQFCDSRLSGTNDACRCVGLAVSGKVCTSIMAYSATAICRTDCTTGS